MQWLLPTAVVLVCLALPARAQNGQPDLKRNTVFEQIIYEAKQHRLLSYLADDQARGRATGTRAGEMVAGYIRREMESYGVLPFFGDAYTQRFLVDSLRAFNIAGLVPALFPCDEYIVICAHFDHIGAINGFVYNGADDNASGVTALLNLAEMFATMRKAGLGPSKNLIFVAFDAKERNMAGSRHFVSRLPVAPERIRCAVNLDQIGSVLEPVHPNRPEYVIILGEHTLPRADRGLADFCNRHYRLGLDIDHTFYGSRNFTELYYRLSDQAAFSEAGIPALLFTSGFHRYTYKTTDDVNLISFPVLKKRTLLAFYLIKHL